MTDTTSAALSLLPCGDCGMLCAPGEYHPYAACLMFKACSDSIVVRANLDAVRAQPTPPAVVEPLTDERIAAIWAAKPRYHAAPIGSTDLEFARDIESAHGIKKGDSHG